MLAFSLYSPVSLPQIMARRATPLAVGAVDESVRDLVSIELEDGSEFTLPEVWSLAFMERFTGREDEVKAEIAERVAEHHTMETKPDREGIAVDWEKDLYRLPGVDDGVFSDEYETHADLAPEVIFPYLRDNIVQIAMREMKYGDDDSGF